MKAIKLREAPDKLFALAMEVEKRAEAKGLPLNHPNRRRPVSRFLNGAVLCEQHLASNDIDRAKGLLAGFGFTVKE